MREWHFTWMARLRAAATLLILLAAGMRPAHGANDKLREKYAPEPGAGYPQILQAHDYATIRFIEALYGVLRTMAPPTEVRSETAIDLEIIEDVMTFRGRGPAGAKSVVVRLDDSAVAVGKRRFQNAATITLYATLARLLRDMSAEEKCRGVALTQFANRAYKTRTLIGFDFGARVLEIDCLSNGPKDDERLYVLDVVGRGDSFFWFDVSKEHRP